MTKPLYIYVLALVENKYYIGKTTDLENRLNDHYNQTSRSAYWTQKYLAIGVVDLLIMANDYDEDKMVFEYMERYGIDNVRGGSFSRVNLTSEQKKMINHLLDSANDRCFKCAGNHFATSCRLKLSEHTPEELEEIKEINRKLARDYYL